MFAATVCEFPLVKNAAKTIISIICFIYKNLFIRPDVTDPNNNITEFEDINEQLISQAVFFSLVTNGNIVGAEGKLDSSGGVSWEKLEIEDEE